MLALVGLLCFAAAWRALNAADMLQARRWLFVAAGLAGLAAFSDYVGIAWIVFVALVGLKQGWRSALAALGIGAGALAIGLLVCFALSPAVFIADALSTGGRAAGDNPLVALILWLFNYQRLLTYDAWLALGAVGLFLASKARVRGALLGAAGLLALVILKVRTVGPSVHTITPLLPFLALGAGVALAAGGGAALRVVSGVAGAAGSLAGEVGGAAAWRGCEAARGRHAPRAHHDGAARFRGYRLTCGDGGGKRCSGAGG